MGGQVGGKQSCRHRVSFFSIGIRSVLLCISILFIYNRYSLVGALETQSVSQSLFFSSEKELCINLNHSCSCYQNYQLMSGGSLSPNFQYNYKKFFKLEYSQLQTQELVYNIPRSQQQTMFPNQSFLTKCSACHILELSVLYIKIFFLDFCLQYRIQRNKKKSIS